MAQIKTLLNKVKSLLKSAQNKPKLSLLAHNINWCTNSQWIDRLIAYKQLDRWTYGK